MKNTPPQQTLLKNWIQLIESSRAEEVLLAIGHIKDLPMTPAMGALIAVTAQKWTFQKKRNYINYADFQCNELKWGEIEEERAVDISALLLDCLEKYNQAGLWQASAIFRLTFPTPVYIGNADTGGYEGDCVQYWADYEPFAECFEEALLLSEKFSCQFITVAQVLWSHFRWQPDNDHEGKFSAEAAGYFLEKSLTLQVPFPIHYCHFFEKFPYIDEKYNKTAGKIMPLCSALGITHFYYAQFCQYHTPDWEKAIHHYQIFLTLEPNFLPSNQFILDLGSATERSYPPSTQEALTETGKIYLQQKLFDQAFEHLEKAVSLRPDNHQAPYEWLSAVCMEQIETFQYHYASRKLHFYFHYDPKASVSKISYHTYAHIFITRVSDNYKFIADTYLFELFDFSQASHFYKKYLPFCKPEEKVEIFENQVRMAMDIHDYWQVRGLCEKILKIDRKNSTASFYQKKIRQILGY